MVYFIQGQQTRLIKIGRTSVTNVNLRLKACQIGSPDVLVVLKIIAAEHLDENYLHKRFKHLRVHGEWFIPGKDLLKFIETQEAWIKGKPYHIQREQDEKMERVRKRLLTPSLSTT